MTELGPESRVLIDEERALGEPTPDELESRRRAVFAALGLPLPDPSDPGGGGGAPPGPGAAPAGGSLGVATGSKVAVVLGVAAIGALGFLATRPPDRAPRSPAPVVVAPVDVSPIVEPAVERTPPPAQSPVVVEPPVVRREPRTPAPASVAPPIVAIENHEPPPEPLPNDSLSEESMLVAAAEAQLRAGHASEALSLYDRALARHPTGSLRAEALSGRIASLCRLGRTDDGRRELERFLASYPRSPSAPRLRTACGDPP